MDVLTPSNQPFIDILNELNNTYDGMNNLEECIERSRTLIVATGVSCDPHKKALILLV